MDLIKKRLTSAEITNLWIYYIQETMAIPIIKMQIKEI
ncbi:hypothetical protein A33I_20380 [Alkalihalophilus marmarensis DSM 21297]|uniref:Uncharacterized protein n=1 Tax=Alkalihalophilus marmarensis DSM 21297 TaxID=1188261 RepID=U6SII2_9BACI|nr:hypothetical protein A33I_20380 [Alkalihalophilus marmarensis DSM 21297]